MIAGKAHNNEKGVLPLTRGGTATWKVRRFGSNTHRAGIGMAIAVAFVVGWYSRPKEVERVMPGPGHVWIGFDLATRGVYFANNSNHVLLRGLSYTVRPWAGTNSRLWTIRFEEQTHE